MEIHLVYATLAESRFETFTINMAPLKPTPIETFTVRHFKTIIFKLCLVVYQHAE